MVNRARGLFLSVHVDDIKLAGKTENTEPTWKILMKDVDLGEPTSFLDLVCLGCTQRECQISKDVVANYRDMLESRISAGAEEKQSTRASGKDIVSWWRIERFNNYTKSQRHAWMTINQKKKKMSQ